MPGPASDTELLAGSIEQREQMEQAGSMEMTGPLEQELLAQYSGSTAAAAASADGESRAAEPAEGPQPKQAEVWVLSEGTPPAAMLPEGGPSDLMRQEPPPSASAPATVPPASPAHAAPAVGSRPPDEALPACRLSAAEHNARLSAAHLDWPGRPLHQILLFPATPPRALAASRPGTASAYSAAERETTERARATRAALAASAEAEARERAATPQDRSERDGAEGRPLSLSASMAAYSRSTSALFTRPLSRPSTADAGREASAELLDGLRLTVRTPPSRSTLAEARAASATRIEQLISSGLEQGELPAASSTRALHPTSRGTTPHAEPSHSLSSAEKITSAEPWYSSANLRFLPSNALCEIVATCTESGR